METNSTGDNAEEFTPLWEDVWSLDDEETTSASKIQNSPLHINPPSQISPRRTWTYDYTDDGSSSDESVEYGTEYGINAAPQQQGYQLQQQQDNQPQQQQQSEQTQQQRPRKYSQAFDSRTQKQRNQKYSQASDSISDCDDNTEHDVSVPGLQQEHQSPQNKGQEQEEEQLDRGNEEKEMLKGRSERVRRGKLPPKGRALILLLVSFAVAATATVLIIVLPQWGSNDNNELQTNTAVPSLSPSLRPSSSSLTSVHPSTLPSHMPTGEGNLEIISNFIVGSNGVNMTKNSIKNDVELAFGIMIPAMLAATDNVGRALTSDKMNKRRRTLAEYLDTQAFSVEECQNDAMSGINSCHEVSTKTQIKTTSDENKLVLEEQLDARINAAIENGDFTEIWLQGSNISFTEPKTSTSKPSLHPSFIPSFKPSKSGGHDNIFKPKPSAMPTNKPSSMPSAVLSLQPSSLPSTMQSMEPTITSNATVSP